MLISFPTNVILDDLSLRSALVTLLFLEKLNVSKKSVIAGLESSHPFLGDAHVHLY